MHALSFLIFEHIPPFPALENLYKMKNKESEELSILIEPPLHAVSLKKLNQNAECQSNGSNDDENGVAKRNGSPSVQTASLLESQSRIGSSYEDRKNSTSASCDSVYGFFGKDSDSSSSSSRRSQQYSYSSDSDGSESGQRCREEINGANFLHNVDENKERDTPKLVNYFSFLDDYIRFDVSRTGVSCFSGYSISVQYEDDFLVGNAGTACCNPICGANSRVRLRYRGEKAFELEYRPRVSCISPKNCVYKVKVPDQQTGIIGTIHFQEDLVRIVNTFEECLAFRRKQGTNCYVIRTESGEKLASVEIFRGFRGDIIYYGLSILGDVTSTNKALLIALTVIMDIRQRESQMRCSLLWTPLLCVLVIGFFTIVPWMYFSAE